METGSLRQLGGADVVAEHLRTQIADIRLLPGDRLRQGALASKLGVGKPAVREGLRQLSGEGLIDLVTLEGARVRVVSRSSARELLEMSATLEGLAAKLSALNMQELGRERLADAFDLTQSDQGTFITSNLGFHTLIGELSGNRELAREIRKTRLLITLFELMARDRIEDPRQRQNEHLKIVEAIFGGRASAAEQAMYSHVEA